MEEKPRERNESLFHIDNNFKQKIKDSAKKFTENTKEFRDKIRKRNNEIRKKLMTNKEVKKVAKEIEKISRKDEEPKFLRVIDKLMFCYGIFSLFFTFALLFYPKINTFANWIIIKNAGLLTIRFIKYKRKKWHYFYFDYCYYVNFFLWAYLLFFPKS